MGGVLTQGPVLGDVQAGAPTLLRRLLVLAERQGGLLSVRQAARLGVSNRMLLFYAAQGDLQRVVRGVYRVSWKPRHPFEDVIAACLRVDGAVACGETALAVWELVDAMPGMVVVCRPTPWHGELRGVRVAGLADDERAVRADVPVTALGRTLADLAATDPERAADALVEALDRDLLATRDLSGLVDRYATLTGPAERVTADRSSAGPQP